MASPQGSTWTGSAAQIGGGITETILKYLTKPKVYIPILIAVAAIIIGVIIWRATKKSKYSSGQRPPYSLHADIGTGKKKHRSYSSYTAQDEEEEDENAVMASGLS